MNTPKEQLNVALGIHKEAVKSNGGCWNANCRICVKLNEVSGKLELVNGYDYTNQAWVMDGRYQDCGHAETFNCSCFGRKHKGQEVTS